MFSESITYMTIIGVCLLVFAISYKLKLDWIRIIMLLLLPSFLYALYGVTEIKNSSHIFESFKMMYMLSLIFMFPFLLVFSTLTLWIEKKFKLNFLTLIIVSIFVGGLSALPTLLNLNFLGKDALYIALITAPIAVLIEGFVYRWRKSFTDYIRFFYKWKQ